MDKASTERSDVCAVPAASVVAEAEVAFIIAQAYLDKFGSDNMTDIKANIESFKKRIKTMVALSLKHRAGAFVAERH